MSDAPHPSGNDRIAVYAIRGAGPRSLREHRRIATTSLEGLGLCLLTLTEEGEFENEPNDNRPRPRVGVFDREDRRWLVNPWAGQSPWIPTGDD